MAGDKVHTVPPMASLPAISSKCQVSVICPTLEQHLF